MSTNMMETGRAEQFGQIINSPVWDGNLISKAYRDKLIGLGLVEQSSGYTFLTPRGVDIAIALGFLSSTGAALYCTTCGYAHTGGR